MYLCMLSYMNVTPSIDRYNPYQLYKNNNNYTTCNYDYSVVNSNHLSLIIIKHVTFYYLIMHSYISIISYH